MLFNSWQFAIFLPIVFILYYYLPFKFRWAMLLIASCIFYMVFIPYYILILALTILVDYFAAIKIEGTEEKKRKKIYLIVSIVSTCLILFIFKYYDFFISNFNQIGNLIHWNYSINTLKIILPIGLSFHTFQSLSYVIEVYRGKQKAEKNFGIYSLYVMFFPQLVAGPIERPQNLIHQFYQEHKFDYEKITNGLKKIAWGLFKKVVIADRIALLVNPVFDNPTKYQDHGIIFVIASFLFAFQIFCDFSGYSDIAIGSAQILGFKLMKNFDRPYFSESISEFWKRWHISLSSWFRDYLYIPLGGNKVSKSRYILNIMVVFLLSGFWHGANWTFVVWGGLHGSYLIFSKISSKLRLFLVNLLKIDYFPKTHSVIKIIITFILVDIGWVFFRAPNIDDALYILKLSITKFNISDINLLSLEKLNFNVFNLFIVMFFILLMEIVHFIQRKSNITQILSQKPLYFRWGIYVFISLIILYFGIFTNQKFIYFQF